MHYVIAPEDASIEDLQAGRKEPERLEREISRPLRILVVEDELVMALLVESMIASQGHHLAGRATSLAAALEAIRTREFDAALLDVNIGRERVFPVAEMLLDRGTPFLFLTACSAEEIPDRFRAIPLLRKPVTESGLERALTGLAAHR
jgi:CheY-like chemotaxis protein